MELLEIRHDATEAIFGCNNEEYILSEEHRLKLLRWGDIAHDLFLILVADLGLMVVWQLLHCSPGGCGR